MNNVDDLKARLRWLKRNAKAGFGVKAEAHPSKPNLSLVIFTFHDPAEEEKFLEWKSKYDKRQAR